MNNVLFALVCADDVLQIEQEEDTELNLQDGAYPLGMTIAR